MARKVTVTDTPTDVSTPLGMEEGVVYQLVCRGFSIYLDTGPNAPDLSVDPDPASIPLPVGMLARVRLTDGDKLFAWTSAEGREGRIDASEAIQ